MLVTPLRHPHTTSQPVYNGGESKSGKCSLCMRQQKKKKKLEVGEIDNNTDSTNNKLIKKMEKNSVVLIHSSILVNRALLYFCYHCISFFSVINVGQ